MPQRMCVACREEAGKRALVRIVRTADRVQIDPTGKLSGRGAYLHPTQACWQRALEHRLLQRALRTQIAPADLAELTAYAQTLPADDSRESSF